MGNSIMTYINSRRIRETVGAIVDEYRKNQQENIGTLKPPKSLGQLGMDRDKQILTCKKYGFTKRYDMRYYHAKPVYEYELLRKVKIYDDKKTVTEISVSPMHKNQIKMIYALCNEDV